MLRPELGEDRMLALELVLAGGDLAVLGRGVGLAALVVSGKGRGAVREEELLPGVEAGDTEAVLFTKSGDRDVVEEMLPEHGGLWFDADVTALPVPG